MKTSIKTFALAIVTSLVFLACDDASDNNAEQEYKPDYPFISRDKIPTMDSRVVSYKSDYGYYGNKHLITDKDTLKLLFPHIFNGRKGKSECNYFALYFINPLNTNMSYSILSEDMNLNLIHCNSGGKSLDIILILDYSAMLVCDDKKGTLRERIDLDSTRNYIISDWDCQSDKGSPNWEEVYF